MSILNLIQLLDFLAFIITHSVWGFKMTVLKVYRKNVFEITKALKTNNKWNKAAHDPCLVRGLWEGKTQQLGVSWPYVGHNR